MGTSVFRKIDFNASVTDIVHHVVDNSASELAKLLENIQSVKLNSELSFMKLKSSHYDHFKTFAELIHMIRSDHRFCAAFAPSSHLFSQCLAGMKILLDNPNSIHCFLMSYKDVLKLEMSAVIPVAKSIQNESFDWESFFDDVFKSLCLLLHIQSHVDDVFEIWKINLEYKFWIQQLTTKFLLLEEALKQFNKQFNFFSKSNACEFCENCATIRQPRKKLCNPLLGENKCPNMLTVISSECKDFLNEFQDFWNQRKRISQSIDLETDKLLTILLYDLLSDYLFIAVTKCTLQFHFFYVMSTKHKSAFDISLFDVQYLSSKLLYALKILHVERLNRCLLDEISSDDDLLNALCKEEDILKPDFINSLKSMAYFVIEIRVQILLTSCIWKAIKAFSDNLDLADSITCFLSQSVYSNFCCFEENCMCFRFNSFTFSFKNASNFVIKSLKFLPKFGDSRLGSLKYLTKLLVIAKSDLDFLDVEDFIFSKKKCASSHIYKEDFDEMFFTVANCFLQFSCLKNAESPYNTDIPFKFALNADGVINEYKSVLKKLNSGIFEKQKISRVLKSMKDNFSRFNKKFFISCIFEIVNYLVKINTRQSIEYICEWLWKDSLYEHKYLAILQYLRAITLISAMHYQKAKEILTSIEYGEIDFDWKFVDEKILLSEMSFPIFDALKSAAVARINQYTIPDGICTVCCDFDHLIYKASVLYTSHFIVQCENLCKLSFHQKCFEKWKLSLSNNEILENKTCPFCSASLTSIKFCSNSGIFEVGPKDSYDDNNNVKFKECGFIPSCHTSTQTVQENCFKQDYLKLSQIKQEIYCCIQNTNEELCCLNRNKQRLAHLNEKLLSIKNNLISLKNNHSQIFMEMETSLLSCLQNSMKFNANFKDSLQWISEPEETCAAIKRVNLNSSGTDFATMIVSVIKEEINQLKDICSACNMALSYTSDDVISLYCLHSFHLKCFQICCKREQGGCPSCCKSNFER